MPSAPVRIGSVLWPLVAVFAAFGCKKTPVDTRPVSVLASVFPACDFAQRLLAGDGTVHCLAHDGRDLRGGATALTSDPEASAWAVDAQLLVVSGGVDGWVEPWAKTARKGKEIKLFRFGDRVPSTELVAPAQGEGDATDPYVWLDSERARLLAKALGEELARVDKKNALAIQQRATALEEKIGAFDKSLEPKLAALPAGKYATSRPFLGPFAERWKLTLASSGATSGTAVDIVAQAKTAGATVFVIDRTRDDRAAFVAAAKDAGMTVRTVDPIGADVGSAPGSYEAFINRFFDDLSKP